MSLPRAVLRVGLYQATGYRGTGQVLAGHRARGTRLALCRQSSMASRAESSTTSASRRCCPESTGWNSTAVLRTRRVDRPLAEG